MHFGVDHILAEPARWRGWHRVGLVTNDGARCGTDVTQHSRVALQQAGVPLVRLFGPEHGLAGSGDDGAAMHDGRDPRTGLPVVSLYGTRMRPDASHLRDLDVMLVDLPDVGARCYTYAWTLFHTLAACADANVPVVVLDRPNPLGGVLAACEGPLVDDACRSFLGEDAIPLRHGCTLGQLARLWRHERHPHLALDVVAMETWDATRAWPATGVPWVPTSPAMPHFDSAVWYPGTCLGEAVALSVGRGTDMPFEVWGAPWLDADAVAAELASHALPALDVSVVTFTPRPGPWSHAGEPCRGVRLVVRAPAAAIDRAAVVARDTRPVRTALALLNAIARRHPQEFTWTTYPTAANPTGDGHFERLFGRAGARADLAARPWADLREQVDRWIDLGDWCRRLAAAGIGPG